MNVIKLPVIKHRENRTVVQKVSIETPPAEGQGSSGYEYKIIGGIVLLIAIAVLYLLFA